MAASQKRKQHFDLPGAMTQRFANRALVAAAWACVANICFVAGASAQARKPQATPQPVESAPASPRLLTSQEAQAIVAAAREHRLQARKKADCSHLVHDIYRRAGFEYPYSNSSDLYGGIEHFVRVKEPQRGDLIVWPGHVGIVVEPVMRAFYSSLRSGLRLDFYDSPYWRRRGVARFYRYVARPDAETQSSAAKAIAREPAAADATILASSPGAQDSELRTLPPSAENAATDWPEHIPVRTPNQKPTADDITEAISELHAAVASALRGRDLLKLDRSILIVDQMDVEQVDTKARTGKARIRSELRLAINKGRVDMRRARERRQWDLRHKNGAWELRVPQDRVYLPRDVAIGLLAMQLASLSEGAESAAQREETERRQVMTARMLSAVVEPQENRGPSGTRTRQ